MNNFNIHLEIRNPKKQAIDTKLEARACYLMNRCTEEQRNESRGTTGNRLGLGFRRRNVALDGTRSPARSNVARAHGVEDDYGRGSWRGSARQAALMWQGSRRRRCGRAVGELWWLARWRGFGAGEQSYGVGAAM